MPDPTALYPTPTRLALLLAVQAGNVIEGANFDHLTEADVPHTFLLDDSDPPRIVDARIREAEGAGWVVLEEPITWLLTDAGRRVLADA